MIIVLSQRVEKALLKLDVERKAKIISSFLELTKDPYIGKELVGVYKGYYSLRAWPFKIIYKVQGRKEHDFVHIIEIG